MIFNTPERVRALTPLNPFPRSEDGRPRVPDELLERVGAVTNEEAWGVFREAGYHFQFEGNWRQIHPDVTLVGRAVTASFVPLRPDLQAVVEAEGERFQAPAKQNTWIIDQLKPGDVLVVDLFGKIRNGTFVGDNLSTAVWSRTGTGLVIDGGARDTLRIEEIEGISLFVRGVDPSAIAEVTLNGVNVPVRIGQATAMPGDVVLGTRQGVTFIPPHLVEEVVTHSEETRLRDVFGKLRISQGRYTSGQIDRRDWAADIMEDYGAWREERRTTSA
ncbi:MAG TPA: RraA family protein [Candidatus Dormibacteraeota bacterium]|jgi:regulator of RNase E activity RraA|nr:RraA family protein [Candidatus Dormibacteraeota bacterium]